MNILNPLYQIVKETRPIDISKNLNAPSCFALHFRWENITWLEFMIAVRPPSYAYNSDWFIVRDDMCGMQCTHTPLLYPSQGTAHVVISKFKKSDSAWAAILSVDFDRQRGSAPLNKYEGEAAAAVDGWKHQQANAGYLQPTPQVWNDANPIKGTNYIIARLYNIIRGKRCTSLFPLLMCLIIHLRVATRE